MTASRRWLDKQLAPAALPGDSATVLASAAMEGRWQRAELAERLADTGLLGPVAAEELALRLLDLSPRWPHGTVAELAHLLTDLPDLDPPPQPLPSVSLTVPPPQWQAAVPRWCSAEELAAALDLDLGELSWFADVRGWNRHAPQPLRHYQARWVATRSGGWRLIEAPKPRLAELQRRLLRRVLAKLPLPDAAHGFRPGRSVATFAAPHAGQALVIRLDLEGFFATVSLPRVHGLLRNVGYPPAVARLLAGLLTTVTPVDVLAAAPRGPGSVDVAWRLRRRLAIAHLPQGAPSSPAVANLIARRLDRRLGALAELLGVNYTRYADDLAFSGPATVPLHRLLPGARRIVTDEGFRLREDKTRIAAAHQRQRLAGLVVNVTPAVPRADYDALRAELHNCLRTGPAEQNHAGHPDYRAHLRGRIAWIAATHPARGTRLLEMWQRISW